MSFIKCGVCVNCGTSFYWSMGHPEGWDIWCNVKDAPPLQKWWFSFGRLCPACAPPLPEEYKDKWRIYAFHS